MSKYKKYFRDLSSSHKRKKLALIRLKYNNNLYFDMEKYEINNENENDEMHNENENDEINIENEGYEINNENENYKHNIENETGSTSNIPLNLNELYSNNDENQDTNVNHNLSCEYSDDDQTAFNNMTIQTNDITNCNLEQSFALALRTVFLKHNINHIQSNAILNILRTHCCFAHLPKRVKLF